MNRIREFIDSRLQPPYLGVVAGALVVVGLLLGISLFVTSDRGRTAFGIPLGADFAGFYVAAEILNRGEPSQLYDRSLHNELYHELLPAEDQNASIPYVHPPFVAGLLRPLAKLPYPAAVAIWQLLTITIFVAAVVRLLRSLNWDRTPKPFSKSAAGIESANGNEIDARSLNPPCPSTPSQRGLIVLLALSFEPFLFECLLGGQLSAIAFGSFALCLAAIQRDRPLSAGMALGICFYKPTLLLLMLPMLVIGKCWRLLAGMTITGVILVLLSLALVGWDVNVGYLNVLLSFQKSTSGGDLEIRTWKYVDLNNCLRLLLGDGSSFRIPLFAAIGFVPFAILSRIWWGYDRSDLARRNMIWATTLTWIPVLNLYFGIYDSILIVQSMLMTATTLLRRKRTTRPFTESGFAYLVLAIYLAPWFSPSLAAMTGISVYTLLLMTLGVFQFRLLRTSAVLPASRCATGASPSKTGTGTADGASPLF